jgi:hypothetical protein
MDSACPSSKPDLSSRKVRINVCRISPDTDPLSPCFESKFTVKWAPRDSTVTGRQSGSTNCASGAPPELQVAHRYRAFCWALGSYLELQVCDIGYLSCGGELSWEWELLLPGALVRSRRYQDGRTRAVAEGALVGFDVMGDIVEPAGDRLKPPTR